MLPGSPASLAEVLELSPVEVVGGRSPSLRLAPEVDLMEVDTTRRTHTRSSSEHLDLLVTRLELLTPPQTDI